jgi:hypothetical protein
MRTCTATVIRNVMLTTAAVLMALAATTPSGAALGPRDQITFSRPIALPGVVLPAGSYTFEVVNPDSSSAVVRVAHRDTHQVYFSGFTMAAVRPANLPADRVVTVGEAPAGGAIPITAWYPTGRVAGHRFVW